jgi:hypothetical protein
VVTYHGLARHLLRALGFLVRPLLNGGTLGGALGMTAIRLLSHRIASLACLAAFTWSSPVLAGNPTDQAAQPMAIGHNSIAVHRDGERSSIRFQHVGFYARLAVGQAHSYFFGNRDSASVSLTGSGPAFALALGGTPFPGFAVGGIFAFAASSGRLEGGPPGPNHPGAVAPLLGAFVDWYPVPRSSWHLGGAVGLGGFSGTDAAHNQFVGYAPAFALFAGYDLWLTSDWALGLDLVEQGSTYAHARHDQSYRLASASIGFRMSVLYY